uniref:tachykinin receptor 3-like n=1 Tax=Doryrhamphus excisus TaxID=161450 RepID=UPI0025AEC092
MAIIHPLKPHLSAKATLAVIMAIWTLAVVLAFPLCYFYTVQLLPHRTLCYVAWPRMEEDADGGCEYHIIVIVLVHVVLLVVMGVAYSTIEVTL